MKKTQARKVWEFVAEGKWTDFTADEVAEKTDVDVQTVRHYFTYWEGKGTMERAGKVEEEPGKRGRPRILWSVTEDSKFSPVWR